MEFLRSTRELKLRVNDNGIGFRPESSGNDGLGLTSMRERVTSIGGKILIKSAPKQGTTIEASVPLPKSNQYSAGVLPLHTCELRSCMCRCSDLGRGPKKQSRAVSAFVAARRF
jgi:Histidine kinase-, DNA gyrase B-, and HSP90-like ATPase